MKKIVNTIFLILTYHMLIGQNCITEEIKIKYTNGLEIFNVCTENPKTVFDENKEYYWYSEYSKIKSTKGGCGGDLLNGNYKFFDELGNLREDSNYKFGLQDGNKTTWDSLGNIVSKTTYDKGKVTYWKFKNEDDYWIEFNGPMFEAGTVRKVYSLYGTLLSEEKTLKPFGLQEVKIYYENSSRQVKEVYTSTMGGESMSGKYTHYYENGKIKTEGQFYEGEYLNIQVGKWKWYNEDGTLDLERDYKAEVTFWLNGEIKMAGGLVFDSDTKEWIKNGEWKWFKENGHFEKKIKYEWGKEVDN